MYTKGKSLADHIDELARRTGAPSSYVDKVRALFVRKGIPLDADAAPYVGALEEAFTRQETIRKSVTQAVQNLVQIQQQLGALEKTRAQYVAKLRDIRDNLQRQCKGDSIPGAAMERTHDEKKPLVRGDHDIALVPGPNEVQ